MEEKFTDHREEILEKYMGKFFAASLSRKYICKYVGFTNTLAVWTPKTFFPLLTRPQGSQGCQKIRFFCLQMKMFSFCAKIAPRRHKLQKTIKIEEKMSNKPCFLGLF